MSKRFATFVAAIGFVLAVPLIAFAAPSPKVTICHIPPGNPANAHTITIGAKAVASHMANHGDTMGPCPEQPNRPPEAEAGDDVCAILGEPIVLDGSGSSDPDGDALTYSWRITQAPAGSTATIDDPAAVVTEFTPDRLGDYGVELEVSDGNLSDTDGLTVGVTMVVTLDSRLYVVATGESLPAAVSLEGPAPPGGVEVHVAVTPVAVGDGETPAAAHVALTEGGAAVDSIMISAGSERAEFFIVGEAPGTVILTVQVGSETCNRQDDAEVVVATTLLEAVMLHIDEDLEKLAADLERLLEIGLSQDPEFELSELWTRLAEARISLGILIAEVIALLESY